MKDDGSHKAGERDARYAHSQQVGVFGSYDPFWLADEMAYLAGMFRLQPGQRFESSRLLEAAGGGVSLCAVVACPGCGRTLVSAVHSEQASSLGFCGRCKPLSPAGRVDHAEWVAKRRAAA